MKKLICLIALACAISTAPIGCAFFQKPTTQKVAYNTLFSVSTAVNKTYDSYLDAVLKGTLATNSFPKVAAGYNTFQTVLQSAVVLVASNTNAPAPPAVIDAAKAFTDTVTAARKGAL